MATPLAEIRAVMRGLLREGDMEITPETRFDDIAAWDPMDLVALVTEVESRFGVAFELPDIDRLASIGDLLDMIQAKQALAAA